MLLTTFRPYTNSSTKPQSQPMCAFGCQFKVWDLELTSTGSKHVRLCKNTLTLQSKSASHGGVYSRPSCFNNMRICTSMSNRTKQRKLLRSENKYMQI